MRSGLGNANRPYGWGFTPFQVICVLRIVLPMTIKHFRFSIPFIISAILVGCTTFLQGDDGSAMSKPMAEQSLQYLKGREFEVLFLKDMITHHEGAIDMAKLAQKNTKRPELNEMAGNIISAQNKEISQMKGWLLDWYQEKVSTSTMAGMKNWMSQGSKMKALHDARDRSFDILFLEQMIDHHQAAVDMSKLVSDRAGHSALKDLAKTIIEDQSREIQQMKDWKKTW